MAIYKYINADGQNLQTAGNYCAEDIVVGMDPAIKKPAATYTPGTTDQTIAAGQYLSGTQTIKGDANLVSGNILAGKSIFGVAGSVTPGITPSGTKQITENGTFDVTQFASAAVNVEGDIASMLINAGFNDVEDKIIVGSRTSGYVTTAIADFGYTIPIYGGLIIFALDNPTMTNALIRTLIYGNYGGSGVVRLKRYPNAIRNGGLGDAYDGFLQSGIRYRAIKFEIL